MENRLGPGGKQALLSLVQEGKPHPACAAAQNNWDIVLVALVELSLTLPAAGAGIGAGSDVFSQGCAGSGAELLPAVFCWDP